MLRDTVIALFDVVFMIGFCWWLSGKLNDARIGAFRGPFCVPADSIAPKLAAVRPYSGPIMAGLEFVFVCRMRALGWLGGCGGGFHKW